MTEFRCFSDESVDPSVDVNVVVVAAANLVFIENGEMCLQMPLHSYGEDRHSFGCYVGSLRQAAGGCGMGSFTIEQDDSYQPSGWCFSFRFHARLFSRKERRRWQAVEASEEAEWCFRGKVGYMGLLAEHLEAFIPEDPPEPNFGA